MPKLLRLGIAGLGAASRQILPHAAHSGVVELAAAADIRPAACEEFQKKYGRVAFPSVEALCQSDIDAVWIATPNVFHAEHTLVAAQCGKHIIVEKPMAVTLDEAERMVAAAKRHRVKLVQGHSKIYGPALRKMREIVASGRLGRAIQINSWNSNDWLQRPRLASEVDSKIGGGVCMRQGPHQADIVRYLGGGLVRSLRASTGRADPNFATEGDYTVFMEFDNGTAATMVFNGYGYFDAAELTWGIGEGGRRFEEAQATAPKSRLAGTVDQEAKYKSPRSTEERAARARNAQSFFGLTIVACERGAIRQSPQGLFVYTEAGREEIACRPDPGRAAELQELQGAIEQGRAPFPDGRWGKATLEVCLAMLQSSHERCEIALSHQVASPDC